MRNAKKKKKAKNNKPMPLVAVERPRKETAHNKEKPNTKVEL